ncbi:CPBP family intramembrane metalloprotease [Corynebacterium canis]|uniref:CPBP family intramembrane metalloprotease n=1 Tax=Corynebacterium canis TaxID=679663 RepID=A0A5C5TV05_9CORY|nr:CPBP family intramembrane glutamic endopeptidase [Corynebacterium canis]TWT17258.1 CPBP family intramembrane metalloprotease [Corynebacterium canis]WJY76445.1 CAAX amino terminal protease self- immunity [Corynebacterium canis]
MKKELGVVLLITFGMQGFRSLLRLIDALLQPAPLNEQSVQLHPAQTTTWLDPLLQLSSAAILIGWGLLVLLLLDKDGIRLPKLRKLDVPQGALLAAVIGLPGLVFYLTALHFGLTKEVVPNSNWLSIVWSFANAFAEETVVVFWLLTRLKQLGCRAWVGVAASASLRGSYHLYQGVSAGVGNIVMGVVFAWVYQRTGRVWPLVIGHFLIDLVAFLGYPLLTALR